MPDGSISRGFLFDAMDDYLDVRQVPQEFINEAYAEHIANPETNERQTKMHRPNHLLTAWLLGAIAGLYALWAFAYDPRSGPAALGDLLVWTTSGALVTTALYAVGRVIRGAVRHVR